MTEDGGWLSVNCTSLEIRPLDPYPGSVLAKNVGINMGITQATDG